MAVNTNDKLISLTQLSTALIKVNNNLANVASEASSNISTIYDRIGYEYLGEFTLLSSGWNTVSAGFHRVDYTPDSGYGDYNMLQFREPFLTYYTIGINVDTLRPHEINMASEVKANDFWYGPNNYVVIDAIFDQNDYTILEEAELFNMTESHRCDSGRSIGVTIFAKRAPTANVKVKLYRHYVNNRNT